MHGFFVRILLVQPAARNYVLARLPALRASIGIVKSRKPP